MKIKQFHDDPEIRHALRGIYPIINIDPLSDIDGILSWAVQLPNAGIDIVQIRAKRFDPEVLPVLLDDLVNELRGSGLKAILNDYVELVRITGADGVHLGMDDLPISNARAMLGQNAIIGATCRDYECAIIAARQGASYIAMGSIYSSSTKSGIPVIGIETLRDACAKIIGGSLSTPGLKKYDHIPVCAIGGIDLSNLKDVYRAGASIVAIVSAIQDAENPFYAAHGLCEEWTRLEGNITNISMA